MKIKQVTSFFLDTLVPVLVMIFLSNRLAAQIKPMPYLFQSQIEQDERLKRYVSLKAEAYSYIGEYEKSRKLYSLEQDTRENSGEQEGPLNEVELAYFRSFHPVDAQRYLLERAATEQVIILNEAHHRPEHRVFAESLLEGLYEQGYRYLGLEALSANFEDSLALGGDTFLNQRGYPLNSYFTGIYTREPQFGNFIRKAIETGFQVFGYERTRFQTDMERDSAEALNVQRVLEKDPDAKMLLYCGYAHLVETFAEEPDSNYGKKRWLAGHLQELTGIDPLTINQEILTERAGVPNSPYYELIVSDKPAVLINGNRKGFKGPPENDKFDLLVYHPPTKWIEGRPQWLYREGKFKAHRIKPDLVRIAYPCQVRAYWEDEPDLAVPVDIIELSGVQQEKALVLFPGKYRIILENETGAIQSLSISIPK